MMDTRSIPDVKSFVHSLDRKPCWYVSVGGSTLPSFQLALGEKIPRDHPLKNKAHPETYRQFEAEVGLLVWCSWRLDDPSGPITNSNDTGDRIVNGLGRLQGARVEYASASDPGWDLRIRFSNDLILKVFCDRAPDDSSSIANWDLWNCDQHLEVAAGSRVEFTERPVPVVVNGG